MSKKPPSYAASVADGRKPTTYAALLQSTRAETTRAETRAETRTEARTEPQANEERGGSAARPSWPPQPISLPPSPNRKDAASAPAVTDVGRWVVEDRALFLNLKILVDTLRETTSAGINDFNRALAASSEGQGQEWTWAVQRAASELHVAHSRRVARPSTETEAWAREVSAAEELLRAQAALQVKPLHPRSMNPRASNPLFSCNARS